MTDANQKTGHMSCKECIMRRIFSTKETNKAIENSRYKEVLENLDVKKYLISYEPGEYVTTPTEEGNLFQIIISGSLSIYSIRADGSVYSLSLTGRDEILGDTNVFSVFSGNVYAEAKEPLTCIAFSIKNNRKALLENAAFLRLIGTSLAEKLDKISMLDAIPSSLEERVLLFMRFICPDGCLKGIQKAAFHLHCSERQLQRLLNKLTEKGLVQKTGKGTYKLGR